MGAREVGDLCDDRAIVAGENHQCVALAVADRLDRCHSGQAHQLGANLRLGTRGYAKPYGVVMARAFGELCGGPIRQNAAMCDDDRPAAHRLDLFEQMGRNDDRLLGTHCSDDPSHLILLVRVETVGRLVEDQHLGIVQQRLRHPDPAFEALRQCLDRLMQHPGDPDHLDDAADAILCLGTGKATDMGDEVEKIGRRHVRIGRRTLRQIADALLCGDGLGRDVMTAHDRGPAGRSEKTGDHLHRRRLAGAVRAEKTEHLAARDGERDVVDRLKRAEMFDQVSYLQHRLTIEPDCGNTVST